MLERDHDFNVQQSRVMCKLEEIIFWINGIIGFGINKREKTTKIVWNHVNYTKVFLVFDIHV